MCRELRATRRAQVRRIAAALRELSTSFVEHAAFLEALRDADVLFAGTLRPMNFPGDSMRLDDPSSSAASWWKDATDAGLLNG